jgi:hypothetical protein
LDRIGWGRKGVGLREAPGRKQGASPRVGATKQIPAGVLSTRAQLDQTEFLQCDSSQFAVPEQQGFLALYQQDRPFLMASAATPCHFTTFEMSVKGDKMSGILDTPLVSCKPYITSRTPDIEKTNYDEHENRNKKAGGSRRKLPEEDVRSDGSLFSTSRRADIRTRTLRPRVCGQDPGHPGADNPRVLHASCDGQKLSGNG